MVLYAGENYSTTEMIALSISIFGDVFLHITFVFQNQLNNIKTKATDECLVRC